LEVLTNLVYLTRHSLSAPEQAAVIKYLDMADVQLRRLTVLLGSDTGRDPAEAA